jgi:hypothetical protein
MMAGAGLPRISEASCPRRDRWIRPCRFEPRYDLGPVEFPAGFNSIEMKTGALDKFRRKTYVGEVCTTCGCVVKP